MARGWVLCGEDTPDPTNPAFLILKNCGTVRNWGTQNGLGELAKEGPKQGSTTIDVEPDGTRINMLFLYREIPCDRTAWASWIAEQERKP